MKITRLQAENVKRITAVDITPEGSLVTIRGRNGQGKSSVLDAIAYALGGKGLLPPQVIHRGAETAQVILETETYTIKRRWTANDRSTISVTSRDGAKYPSPQAMLDRLVGRLSFDPLAFMRLKSAEQAAALRQLVGLDFSRQDELRAELYQERAIVNKELAASRVLYESTTHYPDAPEQPVDLNALVKQMSEMQAEVRRNDQLRAGVEKDRQELEAAKRTALAAAAAVVRAREALARAEAECKDAEDYATHRAAVLADNEESISGLTDPDLAEIRRRLESVETVNAQVEQNRKRALMAEGLEDAKAASDRLSREIGEIDVEKARALAEAHFPVEGLSFDGDQVTFCGLPLEQASDSERLRIAVAMGIAMNPELKVLLIRDGSLLDEDSLAMVGAMAEEAGGQVWLEAVGKEGVGIVIEDGQVEAVLEGAEADEDFASVATDNARPL